MRSVQLILTLCLTVVRPIEGSRLGRLEDDVKSLKSFLYRELSSIRDEVKEISIRVDILENTTVTHDPSSPYEDVDITSYNLGDKTGESGRQLIRDGNNEASHAVKAEIQNMRKAYANDKKDVHQLKQDVKKQLRELEQKITSHMDNLTTDVKHNIEYIHENISLANVTLSEFINESISNFSMFSDTIEKEIKQLIENTSQQLTLQFNKTESKIKQNIVSTYRQNEDNLERFMTLADRNVSQMRLKADNIFNLIRSNFSEMPIQITNLSLELQTTKNEIKGVEERFWDKIKSTSSKLQKDIDLLLPCIHKEITQAGYYYPCAKDIRLANASSYGSTGVQGRLEVHHDKKWGTVCDDSFEHYVGEPYITNNVKVVCRMFGFRECDYVCCAGHGQGSGDILMDNAKCGERDSDFLECRRRGWRNYACSHGEDVGFHMWN
ncbi:MSRE-like protein [Mya arenaria]|uniref:MSRE-like protein n=1 Tax=Mya arenaria TaxID=6604 RepID=A0ABY7G623_MYAAR|nr:RB1-inducible coiled-coil protein 1-like isoform X1 [Mya arenaria]XP_052786701.1 RB1-inducible coiled-coil protein 1-like isoform X1 [Mya arenaria]XP_052786702.1 RB1-inducible coiled-coil protein 1-like isoform X1 [Mya arenaria]WAR29387.1 MSRE-like protein [Mya arenaria]